MKTFHSLSALSVIALVSAQTSKTSLFLLDTDKQPLVASVVSADKSSTVFVLNCPSGTPSDECGTYDLTLTQGPSQVAAHASREGVSATWSCSLKGTTQADCHESVGGPSANMASATSRQLSAEDITFYPVTITAGVDKLAGAASRTPASTSASATTTSGTHVPLWFPELDPEYFAVSVVTVGGGSTVYQLGCLSKDDNCPLPFSVASQAPTLTQYGTTKFVLDNPVNARLTDKLSCEIKATDKGYCSETLVSGSTTRSRGMSVDLEYGSATVTAGAQKLSAAAKTTGGSSSTSNVAGPAVTGRVAAALLGMAGAALMI